MKQCGNISTSGSGFPPLISWSSDAVFDSDSLVCEILSRVPVKSLMSCKCVCKSWQSIICKSPYFIDLHFSRSKSRTSLGNGGVGGDVSLLIEWVRYDWGGPRLLSAEIQLSEGGGGATVQGEIPVPQCPERRTVIVGILNGLFCLADNEADCVCVYNPSTRKSTPWIKSAIKQQHEDESEEIQVIDEDGDHVIHEVTYHNFNWYAFGYDPATEEHKVVAFWQKKTKTWHGTRFDAVCEVLTICGREDKTNNSSSCRRFREVSLPPKVDAQELSKPLYASGSIYWLYEDLLLKKEPFILQFNVRTEGFRMFSVPNFIVGEILYPCRGHLIEVDGHLAVVGKKKVDMECQKNNNTSMKMCILHVNHDQDRRMQNANTVTCMSRVACSTSTDYYWIEEAFLMPPPSDWTPIHPDAILSIPGTDWFIIKSFEKGDFCFYFYNWRTKYFSSTKTEVVGMASLFQDTTQFSSSFFVLRTYSESLLPVV
ncbi:uncharacterized protein LOC113299316 [Papaver somniferum]|uniref:uncharacterized protein LOC113299316 n=1 Tax=Papaver somniferum TaxID=3469 RepID=UPI000E703AF8|nr:uncharacterized protein LOC113299316 [Papaver somniferum]